MKTPSKWGRVGYEYTLPASEATHRRVVDLARAAMMQAGEVDVDFRAVMAAEVARVLDRCERLGALMVTDEWQAGAIAEVAEGTWRMQVASTRKGMIVTAARYSDDDGVTWTEWSPWTQPPQAMTVRARMLTEMGPESLAEPEPATKKRRRAA